MENLCVLLRGLFLCTAKTSLCSCIFALLRERLGLGVHPGFLKLDVVPRARAQCLGPSGPGPLFLHLLIPLQEAAPVAKLGAGGCQRLTLSFNSCLFNSHLLQDPTSKSLSISPC